MSIRDDKRASALDRIADHMLEHGLGPSSLRALAAAAGTSDRMLLYYFTDKEDMVVSALQTVTGRLAPMLLQALPESAPPVPAKALLATLAPLLRGPAFRPYMRLWLEMASLAARDVQPFLAVSGQIADAFIMWVGSRLAVEDEATRTAEAASVIALLDGLVLLDCVGRQDSVDAILDGPAVQAQTEISHKRIR